MFLDITRELKAVHSGHPEIRQDADWQACGGKRAFKVSLGVVPVDCPHKGHGHAGVREGALEKEEIIRAVLDHENCLKAIGSAPGLKPRATAAIIRDAI